MIKLIHGEDNYSSYERAKQIYEEAAKENPSFEVKSIDATLYSTEDIINEIYTASLFASGKIILIRNLSENKGFAEISSHIVKYFANILPSFVIIFWENKKLAKNLRLVKFLSEKKQEELFGVPKRFQLKNDVKKKATELGIPFISEGAIDLFLLKTGPNYNIAYKELEKISLLDVDEITEDIIEENTSNNEERLIWDLTDAISKSDRKTAINVLENFFEIGNDIFGVIPMIARQLRIMLQILLLKSKGIASSDIASRLKLHPFVVAKASAHIENTSVKKIKILFGKLLEIELAVKTGKIDEKLAMSMFCVLI